ncbi:aminotransferase class V-fold PLP-dependent enzyme [Pseudactinotalea sp. Z1739]|uniref:aminotransferase class V-fold PLP-dependent enzyme n=1 Tax=Pseudactinotalea sp. Z1739 TaxID=3413028 RepID=UPI003C7B667F
MGDTAGVAVSAVQSATGEIADLDALESACARHGADLVVDLTQSAGWLDVHAGRFAATVCGAYKWLLSPRGSAFLTVGPELAQRLRPLAANWFAGDDVWQSTYGLPLRLATHARRFDVSPAWHSWVGTEASLRYLHRIGTGHCTPTPPTWHAPSRRPRIWSRAPPRPGGAGAVSGA